MCSCKPVAPRLTSATPSFRKPRRAHFCSLKQATVSMISRHKRIRFHAGWWTHVHARTQTHTHNTQPLYTSHNTEHTIHNTRTHTHTPIKEPTAIAIELFEGFLDLYLELSFRKSCKHFGKNRTCLLEDSSSILERPAHRIHLTRRCSPNCAHVALQNTEECSVLHCRDFPVCED